VNVAKQLLKPLDLNSVLDEILSQVQRLFGYDICCVLLPSQCGNFMYIAAHRGYDPEIVSRYRLPIGGARATSATSPLRGGPTTLPTSPWIPSLSRPHQNSAPRLPARCP